MEPNYFYRYSLSLFSITILSPIAAVIFTVKYYIVCLLLSLLTIKFATCKLFRLRAGDIYYLPTVGTYILIHLHVQ